MLRKRSKGVLIDTTELESQTIQYIYIDIIYALSLSFMFTRCLLQDPNFHKQIKPRVTDFQNLTLDFDSWKKVKNGRNESN